MINITFRERSYKHMKKLLVIMLVAMVTAIAALAFATTTITNPSPAAIGGSNFTPSTGVLISATSNTVGYNCTAAHTGAASGPGYEFQIASGYNGMFKKQWTSGLAWPELTSVATGSVAGFQ